MPASKLLSLVLIFFFTSLISVVTGSTSLITVPVMIAGVQGTAALLQPTPDEAIATMWIAIVTCFDIVFVTFSLWMFEPLMTE